MYFRYSVTLPPSSVPRPTVKHLQAHIQFPTAIHTYPNTNILYQSLNEVDSCIWWLINFLPNKNYQFLLKDFKETINSLVLKCMITNGWRFMIWFYSTNDLWRTESYECCKGNLDEMFWFVIVDCEQYLTGITSSPIFHTCKEMVLLLLCHLKGNICTAMIQHSICFKYMNRWFYSI